MGIRTRIRRTREGDDDDDEDDDDDDDDDADEYGEDDEGRRMMRTTMTTTIVCGEACGRSREEAKAFSKAAEGVEHPSVSGP